MKTLPLAAAALLFTTRSALAHGGAHVHPHGAETWIALVVVAVVAIGCASLMRGGRK
ncbi:peptidase M23 [Tritonibacter horizontis]|uniref:Peptidase M23 n=1 Tax=Tritonibacter horizontis TaxID=1768241 RepID=A0A132BSJ8_9RHOB|nr:peptidase M23 [Tritonibacter horizontis]KUP90730.1 hypothetical protein TRIHO_45970 [Tritonibacter horizontis]